MSDGDSGWQGSPEKDHKWTDDSIDCMFYSLDEIDGLIDAGKMRTAYYWLEEFYTPRSKKNAAEWFHLRARLQANMKRANYRLALRYSGMSVNIEPENQRYRLLHDEIEKNVHADSSLEKIVRGPDTNLAASNPAQTAWKWIRQKVYSAAETVATAAILLVAYVAYQLYRRD